MAFFLLVEPFKKGRDENNKWSCTHTCKPVYLITSGETIMSPLCQYTVVLVCVCVCVCACVRARAFQQLPSAQKSSQRTCCSRMHFRSPSFPILLWGADQPAAAASETKENFHLLWVNLA